MFVQGHLTPLSHAQSITKGIVLEEIKLDLFLGHLGTSDFSKSRELFDSRSAQRSHLYGDTAW